MWDEGLSHSRGPLNRKRSQRGKAVTGKGGFEPFFQLGASRVRGNKKEPIRDESVKRFLPISSIAGDWEGLKGSKTGEPGTVL